jgi:3-hydroxyisobutyrate dehydrogenase-like beta-hydroxyacid dehydrogenase
MKLAVLHPGEMGVTVGAALQCGGHDVYWLPEDRSSATRGRAQAAGFREARSLAELVRLVDGVISVCPPHGALALAVAVKEVDYVGTYVDANAVSPQTAREIEAVIGSNFVDGGIIGPPAMNDGSTRLYLSGATAQRVAGWFDDGVLSASVIAGGAGAASALKMCYAAYTKGSSALLLAIRALAESAGVTAALLSEWEISQPGLARQSEAIALGTARKAWRFVGEMNEIARTFRTAELPGDFHDGAADIYRRMGSLRDADAATLVEVLALLNKAPDDSRG